MNDVTFKQVFSDKEILFDLVNSFFEYLNLDYSASICDITPQVYMLPNKVEVKAYLGDLKVKLINGMILSIEAYKNRFSKNDYEKSLLYECKLKFEQMKEGDKNYNKVKKVMSLNFMVGNFRRMTGKIVNKHSFICTDNNKCVDDGDLDLYLIRVDKKINGEKRFEKWLKLLQAKTIEELEEIGGDDKVMLKMIKRLKNWLSKDENMELEEFIDNIQYRAEEAGIEKGEKLGEARGKKIGEAKGKAEKSQEIAKNMLNKKIDIETITSCTGLNKKEVLSLQRRLY